jgi:diadenosine tetraphosphate (Ap4A) HIT family hydrolase
MAAPSWSDEAAWRGLMSGATCPFCTNGPRGVIADFGSSWVTMDETVPVRGYVCVIPKEHATELHALSDAAAAAYWNDVRRASSIVQNVTGAIKLNYEVHGNVIPHVHMHVVPRYPSDAIETTGLPFARLENTPYRAGEFEAMRSAMSRAMVKGRTEE